MSYAVAAAALAALLLSAPLAAGAAPAASPAAAPVSAAAQRHVVVILAPYLTWEDIAEGPMPQTRAVAASALLADVNVRSTAVGAAAGSPDSGALMLSAGAPTLYDPGALPALDVSEQASAGVSIVPSAPLEGTRVSIVYAGHASQATVNASEPGVEVGSLASAVERAGAVTAALGNSDRGLGVPLGSRSRPAGIAAADSSGRVALGDVSESLLAADGAAPFGVRTDLGVLASDLQAVLATAPACLVVVDSGDLARAHEAGSAHTPALKSLDTLVGAAAGALGPNDTLVVLAQAEAAPAGVPEGFAPLIMRGPLGVGVGTSASTHRDGVVTLPDVSAAIVQALGGSAPSAFSGAPIVRASSLAGAPLDRRLSQLNEFDTTAVAVEAVRDSALDGYIALIVVALIGSASILLTGLARRASILMGAGRALLLLVLCVPLAAIAQFIFVPSPASPAVVAWLLAGLALLLCAAAIVAGRKGHPSLPLLLAAAASSALIVIDQWLGAPLSLVSIFGYSPLFGSRYYGIGNEMAALLLGCTFLAVALAMDMRPGSAWTRHLRAWGWPLLGAIVLVTSAAPMLGANVGTAAWMTVGIVVGWLMLNGRKVWTWRNVLVVLVLVVLFVAALAGIDILRGPGAETHLARAVLGAGGGVGGLWTLALRKAQANIGVFGRTGWAWVCAAALAALAFLRWRPRGAFGDLLAANPAFSAALAAALFAGVVGFLTEDSGIVVSGLVLLPFGVGALYLALSGPRDGGEPA